MTQYKVHQATTEFLSPKVLLLFSLCLSAVNVTMQLTVTYLCNREKSHFNIYPQVTLETQNFSTKACSPKCKDASDT